MTATAEPSAWERILVALDASPGSLAALDTAAELARRARAELVGLFVEDENLLRLGELPLAREIGSFSASARPLEPGEMERRLRAQAARALAALEAAAAPTRLPWSFLVERGGVRGMVLAAAAASDLLLLGRGGGPGPAGRVGSTARAAVREGRGAALILGRKLRLEEPVVILARGGAGGAEALRSAVDLVLDLAPGSRLEVWLLPGPPLPDPSRLLEGRRVGEGAGEARLTDLPTAEPRELRRRLVAVRPGLLVVPAETCLEAEALEALLAGTDTSLLLLRGRGEI